VGGEDGPHEDRGAAAPCTGFDDVPRHPVFDRPRQTCLDVLEPSQPDHGLGVARPVETELPFPHGKAGVEPADAIQEAPSAGARAATLLQDLGSALLVPHDAKAATFQHPLPPTTPPTA